MKPKKVTFDIETSPNIARIWGKYQQDAIAFVDEWKLLSVSFKPLGGKPVFYGQDKYSERELVAIAWKYFDEYDVLIGHNIRKFDIKKVNAKFIEYGLKPPSPYETEDTLQIARNVAAFTSNKLGDLGEKLGLGNKQETGGFKLWLGCENGDPKSWALMKKYNNQDVILTEQIYFRLLPWAKQAPKLFFDNRHCNWCGSKDIQARGPAMKPNHHRFQCKSCFRWFQRKV